MSQLQVDIAALHDAANAAQGAAADAKGHGSSDALTWAAGGLPGASSLDHLRELGTSWDDEIAAWVTATHDFGADLAAAGEDYRSVDQTAGGLFGGLLGGG
jgi:Excreted virulence factor EspC, type VII ESX diderm